MKKFILILILLNVILNAQYRIERVINGGAEKFGEKNYELFNVYNQDQIIYKVERELNYDDPFSEGKLFKDGSLMIVNSFLNKIDFYSNTGSLISHVEEIDNEKFSYEKTIYFAPDMDEAALLISNEKSGDTRIEIYSKFGNKIKSINAVGSKGKGIYFDQTNEIIIYSTIDWNDVNLSKKTYGIDINGNVKFQLENIFDSADVNGNLFLGYSNKSLILINILTNEVLEDLELSEKLILTARLVDNYVLIVESPQPIFVENNWIYSDAEILKYSLETKEWINVKKINYSFKSLEFSTKQKEINLIINNGEKTIKVD